jgi:hypothetical protein
MNSSTPTIIAALQILARDIETEDGIVSTCLLEAADRLHELSQQLEDAHQLNQDIFEILYGQE